MIQILTTLTFSDYLKFNYSLYFKRRFVISFLAISIFIITVLTTAYLRGDLNLKGVKIDSYPVLFLFIMVITFSPLSVYLQSKRNYYSSRGLVEPIHYTFTEKEVYLKGSGFESATAWNLYHKIIETKKFFILYQTSDIVNLIPKVSFASKEQIWALRRLISDNVVINQKLRKD